MSGYVQLCRLLCRVLLLHAVQCGRCDSDGCKQQMYPQHPQQRAQVDRWMHWYHTGARHATTKLLLPHLQGKGAEAVAAGKEEVSEHVKVVPVMFDTRAMRDA